MRELVPSAEIHNDPANVWMLESGSLDTSKIGLDEALIQTDTDALVIIHDNKLAYETYRNGMTCLLYTSPSPRDRTRSRMPSSA